LVDILPTVAELAGAAIPITFPGREPTPLAGISLSPVFAGKELEQRPAIHLMFGQDRAETTNLADRHPERVAAMSAEGHRMAKDEVLATAREQKSVGKEPPGNHPEWTDSSGKRPERKSGGRKKARE
jgi:arylsulfatase